jgi:hypothetical protein
LKPLTKVQALRHIRGYDEHAVILFPHFKEVFGSWGAGAREVLENQRRQIGLMRSSPSRQELVQQDGLASPRVLRLERQGFGIL